MSEVIDISPGILIPACASSSPVFLMLYSAYKLNKQGDNIMSSIILYSKSLIHSSALFILLFIAFSSAFISANEFSNFSWVLSTVSSSF